MTLNPTQTRKITNINPNKSFKYERHRSNIKTPHVILLPRHYLHHHFHEQRFSVPTFHRYLLIHHSFITHTHITTYQ
jgi:hypothetical protein